MGQNQGQAKEFAQERQPKKKPHSWEQDTQDSQNVELSKEVLVDLAVRFESHDVLAKKHGLKAHVESGQMGLTVVLKDASGVEIRRMSGQDFATLSLLHSGQLGALKSPGKILDKKA